MSRKNTGRHHAPKSNKFNKKFVRSAAAAGTSAAILFSTPSVALALPAEWSVIAECESGNQNIESYSPNSSASGYFQIIDGTWLGAGGGEFAPRAIEATFEQQAIVAQRIADGRGSLADWDASRGCWGDQISDAVPVEVVAPVVEAPVVVETTPVVNTYTVVPGDTLSEIGRAIGVNWRDIYNNNITVIGPNPHLIFPDQVYTISQATAPVAPVEETPPVTETPAEEVVEETASSEVVGEFANPVPGATFTSGYGLRDGSLHNGIDLAAPLGTPIYAAAAGTIDVAGPRDPGGFGQAVYMTMDDGTVLWYGHIETWTVEVGQRVEAGQQIATVGSRGHSTGPHLHFEVHIGPGPVNPQTWLADRGIFV